MRCRTALPGCLVRLESLPHTTIMEAFPPLASLVLTQMGIPHRVFVHAGPIESLEQAARERGQRPEQLIRSILFRTGKDEYLLALIAGTAQISWKALRAYLGQRRLTMAKEDEVLRVTGYPIGAVSPFGTARRLRGVANTACEP